MSLTRSAPAPELTKRRPTSNALLAIAVASLTSYAFLPFLRPSAYGTGEESDAITQLAWFAIAGLCVFAMVRGTRHRRLPKVPGLIVAIVALAWLSVLWSVAPSLTIRRAASLTATAAAAHFIGTAFPPRALVTGLRRFAVACALGSLVAAGAAVAHDPDGKFRGVFFHKNQLGLVLALGFVVSVAHFGTTQRANMRVEAVASAVVSGAVLVMSGAATSLIGATVALGALPVGVAFTRKGYRAGAIGFACIALSAVVAAWALGASSLAFHATGKDETLTGRTRLWSKLIDGPIEDRAVTGWGYGAYWRDTNEVSQVVAAAQWQGAQPSSAHNSYLEMWLALGPAGLASLLGAIATSLYAVFRRDKFLDNGTRLAMFAVVALLAWYGYGEGDLLRSRAFSTVVIFVVLSSCAAARVGDASP